MRKTGTIKSIIAACLMATTGGNVQAGVSGITQESDSLRAVTLISLAAGYQGPDRLETARDYLLEARAICTEKNLPYTEAMVYAGLASLYDEAGIWDFTLRYLLMAADRYRNSHDSLPAAAIYRNIAGRYLEFEVPALAADHFIREYNIMGSDKPAGKGEPALGAARALRDAGDTLNALVWYDSARYWYTEARNLQNLITTNNESVPLLAGMGNSASALDLTRINLAVIPRDDRQQLIVQNNNLGFLHFRLAEYDSALIRFERAMEYCLIDPADKMSLTGIYANIAICHQNIGNEQLTFDYFGDALKLAAETGQTAEKARIELLLASLYLQLDDLYNAELYCRECISSAEPAGARETLQAGYALYADVLERGNDFPGALGYYQKHFNLTEEISFGQKSRTDRMAERTLYYETIEQNLKLEIADEELKDLIIRNQETELARRNQEYELLLTQSAVEKARSEISEKELELLRQREESRVQKETNDSLALANARQELALNREKVNAEIQKQKSDSLQFANERQQLELAQEQEARRLTSYIAGLMVLVALGILYTLISTRKKNQKLAASKKKIEEINADLETKNIEILSQKEIIEQKNQSITDSIQYAARIQHAVLLPPDFLTTWGIENFIYFRPKDIVSGDFYWGFRKKGKIFVAAADCTGHGVPGGFMSMLGNAFLNEIVITTDIETASGILDKLRDEIIRALRQKGVTGEARDGMDISLIIYDRKAGTIQFSGANNPVYVVSGGELTRYAADKMPIGIHVTDITPFNNHIIRVRPGDAVYLFSDGYADQFGGESGKKFMYKPFMEMLEAISPKPMDVQLEHIGKAFTDWKGEYDQIDDVLVMGLRIK